MIGEKNIVIIPAYEPDEKLLKLLQEIRSSTDFAVIVVNDGSSADKNELFVHAEQYDALVLQHAVNQGKGQAIKTALREVALRYGPDCTVVLADADGQHKVADMLRVCRTTNELQNQQACAAETPRTRSNNKQAAELTEVTPAARVLVMGCRNFAGEIPAKSKFGNSITRFIFRLVSGISLSDTQTGLRAFKAELIPFMLQVAGSRYEYEMNVLLECAQKKVQIVEIPIDTVYHENNATTHFRAVKDSFLIYKDIFKFGLSSFASFLIDFVFYSIMILLTAGLPVTTSILLSNISARVISASANFYINKRFVFQNEESIIVTGLKYFCLAALILVLNTFLLTFVVNNLISNKIWGKIVVEATLFLFSWTIQKFIIFRKKNKNA